MAYKKGPVKGTLTWRLSLVLGSTAALPSQGCALPHDVFPLPFLELHYVSSRKQPLPSYKHSPGLLTSSPATPQPLSVHPSHLAVTLATYLLDRSGPGDGSEGWGRREGVTHTAHDSSLLTNPLEARGLHNARSAPQQASRTFLEGQPGAGARTGLVLSRPSAGRVPCVYVCEPAWLGCTQRCRG